MKAATHYLLIKLPGGSLRVDPALPSPECCWEYHDSLSSARDAAESDAAAAFILGPDGMVLWRAPWAR